MARRIGLATLLDAIVARDDRGVAAALKAAPDLVSARVAADQLVLAIPHWLYVGDTALHLAACGLRVGATERLLAAGADANATNRRGATPLHYACDPRPRTESAWNPVAQVKTLELLIASGASVQAADKGGATPLHRAARAKSPAAVRTLLAHGARTDALLGKQRTTPLHVAVQSTGAGGTKGSLEEQLEIVALLVEHGADVSAKDAKGKTPRQQAKNPRVLAALGPGC